MASTDQLSRAYQVLLDRPPTRAELDRDRIAGRDLGTVAAAVADSPEHRALLSADEAPGPRGLLAGSAAAAEQFPAGTVSDDEAAIVGHDGWILINRGSNEVVRQITGERALDDARLREWEAVLDHQSREAAELGCDLVHLAVPDKLAILPDRFPRELDVVGPRTVERLREHLPGRIVYPLDELNAAEAEGETCTRTDSHLSLHGAGVVHRAAMDALSLQAPEAVARPVTRTKLRAAGLGRKFDPPLYDVQELPAPEEAVREVDGNAEEVLVRGAHLGTRRVTHNPEAPHNAVAVVFGDSYCSVRGGGLLGTLLERTFRHLHFLWAPFRWDPAYVSGVRPDVVISEIAERNLIRVPPPDVDVHALAARPAR